MNAGQPTSRLVNWAGYLAITFVILLPVSVLAVRSGQWQPGLLLYAIACLGSMLVLLLSAVLIFLPKFANVRASVAKNMVFALPGAVLLLSLLGGGNVPPIHDITTDTDTPPEFITAAQQRGPDANSLEIVAATITAQQAGYPQIKTLRSVLTVDDAFTRALEIASEMGWEVYHENSSTGIIEAVATTGIMGFKDDVVIRVRSDSAGTKVDLRSVSRVGESDLGANAARIEKFQAAFSR